MNKTKLFGIAILMAISAFATGCNKKKEELCKHCNFIDKT